MENKRTFSQLIRAALAAGALATALGSGVALAQSTPGTTTANHGAASLAHRHGAHGTVGTISGQNFVLNTKQGALTVVTNANTRFHSRGHDAVKLSDLRSGMRVNVNGERNGADLVARRVHVRPAKKAHAQKNGATSTQAATTQATTQSAAAQANNAGGNNGRGRGNRGQDRDAQSNAQANNANDNRGQGRGEGQNQGRGEGRNEGRGQGRGEGRDEGQNQGQGQGEGRGQGRGQGR